MLEQYIQNRHPHSPSSRAYNEELARQRGAEQYAQEKLCLIDDNKSYIKPGGTMVSKILRTAAELCATSAEKIDTYAAKDKFSTTKNIAKGMNALMGGAVDEAKKEFTAENIAHRKAQLQAITKGVDNIFVGVGKAAGKTAKSITCLTSTLTENIGKGFKEGYSN